MSAENRSNKVTFPTFRIATAACLFIDKINDQLTECDGIWLKIQHSQSWSSVSLKCSLQTFHQPTVAAAALINKTVSMLQYTNILNEFWLFFSFA
jgi:hypothetical protein